MNIERKAISFFGEEYQMRKCQEECGELIVVINHFTLKRATIEEVLEEVADVQLTLNQMIEVLDDTKRHEQYQIIFNRKKDRFQKRVEKMEVTNNSI